MTPAVIGAIAAKHRAGGGSSHVPALDSYTTALWAAYSLCRELTTYTGPLIRIRNSTTAVETDIGYGIDNRVNQATIATAIGSASATIVKLYDQFGNGRDLAQPATGQQPRIVNAGVYDGRAVFDGVDDCMQTPNLPGTNSGMSLLLYGKIRVLTGSFNVYLEQTADAGANAGLGSFANNGALTLEVASGPPSGANYVRFSNTNVVNDDVVALVGDRTASTDVTISKYYKGGTLLTPLTTTFGSQSGNYAAAPVNVGARNNGASLATQLDVKAMVVYTAAKSGSDIAAISAGLI